MIFNGFSLADSVITELAQLSDLVVRPSSYIVQYQNKDIDPRLVGAQLAVDAVLVGGYLRSGDRFRLTPQLVDTGSGEIVWSEKIDVESKDIITVQDTISRQIVEGLRIRTSAKEQERLVHSPTENAEAYEAYLKGRTMLYKFITQTLDREDLDAAVEEFRTAVRIDPEFSLAYSGLGVCHLNYVLKGMEGSDYYALAREDFDKALSIDPSLIEPRVRLIYLSLIDGQSGIARSEVRRLLKVSPNEPSVHSAAAYVYRLSGQPDKALEEWDHFLKINPTDVVYASYNRARLYRAKGDYARAEAEINKGLAFEPDHPALHAYGAMISYYEGKTELAKTELTEALARHPELHSFALLLAQCYMGTGEREKALALLDDRAIGLASADQDAAYWLASVYALDGDRDQAIYWLERSISMGNENYPWFVRDPNWDQMRQEPRYEQILEQLKTRWEALTQGA